MYSVLIAIQLLVSIALIFMILLQRSEGGALGMGSGGAGLGGLFSPRGATSTLTRTTAALALLFVGTSLALTVLALHTRPKSILDTVPGRASQTLPLQRPVPLPAKPQAPAVPTPHG